MVFHFVSSIRREVDAFYRQSLGGSVRPYYTIET